MGKHNKKKPKQSIYPVDNKIPRSQFVPRDPNPRNQKNPQSSDNQTISWQLHRVDHQGEWGWDNCKHEIFIEKILDKLKNFNTMTWFDAMQQGQSHSILVKDICKEAQKRLEDIKQDDIDTVFSLRLSGKERIWGIREDRVLKVLWWDPEHTVFPAHRG